MAQTLTSMLVHIVFSTKDREELIRPEVEPELYAYVGGICRNHASPLLAAGGTADHVHLLVSLSKTLALCDLVLNIKRDSSLGIKTKGAEYRGFHWQEGYGGFSIGHSQKGAAARYIGRQKEKHQRVTFKQEFLAMLEKYEISYNPEHIWT